MLLSEMMKTRLARQANVCVEDKIPVIDLLVKDEEWIGCQRTNLVMIMYLSTSRGGSNTNLLKVGKVQDLLESKEDVMNDDEAGLVMLNY